jgi:hypothetical protein
MVRYGGWITASIKRKTLALVCIQVCSARREGRRAAKALLAADRIGAMKGGPGE